MRTKVRRRYFLAAGCLALAALAAAVGLNLRQQDAVGSINGLPVYAEELAQYAGDHRASVTGWFSVKYALPGTGPSFWTSEYGGERPVDHLVDETMEELIRTRLILREAADRGLMEDLTGYDAMVRAWEQENAARKEAQTSGGIVYGASAYTLEQYSDYRLTQAADAIKANLLQGESAPDEEALRQAYETLDRSLLRKDFTAGGVAFLWEAEEEDLTRGLRLIEAALQESGDPETVLLRLEAELPGLTLEAIDFDSALRSKDDALGDILEAELFDLEPGLCRASRSVGCNAVYYLTEKTGGGYAALDEARTLAENAWVNAAFDAWLEQAVLSANVTLDRDAARAAVLDDAV